MPAGTIQPVEQAARILQYYSKKVESIKDDDERITRKLINFFVEATEPQLKDLAEYLDAEAKTIMRPETEVRQLNAMSSRVKRNTRRAANTQRYLVETPRVFSAGIKRVLDQKTPDKKEAVRIRLIELLILNYENYEMEFIRWLLSSIAGGEINSINMKGGKQETRKKSVEINGGEKFRIEDASKNWTLTNRYKKWVGKLTRKPREKRHTKAEDLCVGKDNICDGDLGIPRKYMPQFIGKDDVRKFRNFIKRVYGIQSRTTRRKAKDLKPTQKEISRERIHDLIDNENILNKVLVPLVISNDNYVVDGHHRWAAYRLKKPNKNLPVVEIDVPIKDVLGISIAWGAKHQDF